MPYAIALKVAGTSLERDKMDQFNYFTDYDTDYTKQDYDTDHTQIDDVDEYIIKGDSVIEFKRLGDYWWLFIRNGLPATADDNPYTDGYVAAANRWELEDLYMVLIKLRNHYKVAGGMLVIESRSEPIDQECQELQEIYKNRLKKAPYTFTGKK